MPTAPGGTGVTQEPTPTPSSAFAVPAPAVRTRRNDRSRPAAPASARTSTAAREETTRIAPAGSKVRVAAIPNGAGTIRWVTRRSAPGTGFAGGPQEEDPPHLAAARASVTSRCAPRERSRSARRRPSSPGSASRTRRLVLEHLGAVESEDPRAQDERPSLARRRERGDGGAAPGAQGVQEAPLGRRGGVRERVVERREGGGRVGVVPPAGDAERPLGRGRQQLVERECGA